MVGVWVATRAASASSPDDRTPGLRHSGSPPGRARQRTSARTGRTNQAVAMTGGGRICPHHPATAGDVVDPPRSTSSTLGTNVPGLPNESSGATLRWLYGVSALAVS